MILDTGASSVVLTQQAAKAAGLPIEVLSYMVNVDTANGRTRAAQVTLDRLAVDHERDPFLEAEGGNVGLLALLLQCLGHAGEPQGNQTVVGGMRQHIFSSQW